MYNASYEKLLFNAIKNGQLAPKSTYDIWLELGNEGGPEEFLNTLKGTHATIVKNKTIVADSWKLNEGLYKTTIEDENITSDDIINVNFSSESISEAVDSGILGYTISIESGFELFSNFKPTSDLIIDYSIIRN